MDLSTFSRQSQLAWQREATSGDFQHYLTMTQTLLNQVHGPGLSTEMYQPYEWVPEGFWDLPHEKRRGVLLVHGLLDAPSRMVDLAKTYRDQGYLIRTLLLTGHGLLPQALYNIQKEDWLALVQFGIRQLQQDVGQCVLMGHSGGGALCIWHLLTSGLALPRESHCERSEAIQGFSKLAHNHRDDVTNRNTMTNESTLTSNHPQTPQGQIQRMVAFAPPVMLKDPYSILLPLLNLIPTNLIFRTKKGQEIGKYDRFSQHFGYQAHSLARQIRTLLIQHPLPVPTCLVLAAHDETIHSGVARYELLRDKNPAHRVDWYSPKQVHTEDNRVHWHSSVYPAYDIRDFSHISLCTRADNPYYGAIAYQKARAKLGNYARPCFNPDYDAMAERLLAFTADDVHN